MNHHLHTFLTTPRSLRIFASASQICITVGFLLYVVGHGFTSSSAFHRNPTDQVFAFLIDMGWCGPAIVMTFGMIYTIRFCLKQTIASQVSTPSTISGVVL